jgi:hypothetical protein
MQSDEKVARTQMHKKSVERSGSTDSDLAPRGDSEKSAWSMSPLLTATQGFIIIHCQMT